MVVVGESLILMIGGMDLSLEGTYGLAPMVAAWLIVPVSAFGDGTDLNPYLGILSWSPSGPWSASSTAC